MIRSLLAAASLLACAGIAPADYAHFNVAADQVVTGTINGTPTALPDGFRLVLYENEGTDGLHRYSVYPSWPGQPNGSHWAAGTIPAGTFCYWACYMGPFGAHVYPNDRPEQLVVTTVINGYAMEQLRGEAVTIGPDGFGGFNIDIGAPPVRTMGLFEFLAAYFANDPAADINRNGIISVQDIFDFLAIWP